MSAGLDLFLELAALRARRARSAPSPTASRATSRRSGSRSTRTTRARRIGSTTGNLLCRLPAATSGGMPIFLCAHLDTVPPEGPIEPVVEDGVVRNAAGTILGADNKAAVAAMLEAARRSSPRAGRTPASSCCSRRRKRSACSARSAFDHTRLEAELGYVYDQAAPIGDDRSSARRPALDARPLPRPGGARRAWCPEEGRSAIAAAARAIADLRLGRIDEETTANVGLITGGTARNIVPEWCTFEAEARSHDERKLADLVQEMLDSVTFAASLADCEVETRGRGELPRLPLPARRPGRAARARRARALRLRAALRR